MIEFPSFGMTSSRLASAAPASASHCSNLATLIPSRLTSRRCGKPANKCLPSGSERFPGTASERHCFSSRYPPRYSHPLNSGLPLSRAVSPARHSEPCEAHGYDCNGGRSGTAVETTSKATSPMAQEGKEPGFGCGQFDISKRMNRASVAANEKTSSRIVRQRVIGRQQPGGQRAEGYPIR
jgi:hypothetical protein